MNNSKGFSLVEILGVIVILSLLVVASFTILDGVAKRNIDRTYKTQLNKILDGAISYANSNNEVNIPSEEEKKATITLQTLFDEGIIDDNIKNPKTKKKILGTSTIEITYIKYQTNSNIKLQENQKLSGSNVYTFNMIEE